MPATPTMRGGGAKVGQPGIYEYSYMTSMIDVQLK
jgi:hypothetical protein